MLFLQGLTKGHLMHLTRLLALSLFFCFFGCKEFTDKKLTSDQKNKGEVCETIDKSLLDLNPQEGNWYYKGKPFTGNAISYFPNKTKKEILPFYQGKKNGFELKWFSNGRLQKKSFYKNNKLEGVVKSWWENGAMASESHYNHGIRNGVQKTWHPNKKMARLNTLKNGVEEGLQQAWLENGKIYVNCEMKNGRTFGLKRAVLCYELKKEIVQYDTVQKNKLPQANVQSSN